MLEMATSSNISSYHYEPLLENQFRILEITAVHPEICARLVKCVVGQSPPFHALSYAWGSEPNTKAIICDNARILITPHLYECLVSIFLENGFTRLWVDAICIDQSSNREKGAQVAKMHRLYHNADLVYVWLGKASDRSDEAMDAIRDVGLPKSSKDTSKEQLTNRILHLKSQAPKLFQMELFKPIAALSRRPWFQRLWVVQEYLLARSAIFLCGRKTVDGRKLRDTLQRMSIYSFGDGNPPMANEEALFEGYEALRNLERIKANHDNGRTLSFFDFVMLGRSRLAKEPVDRIYAMLGLTEKTDTIYVAKLPVDYSEETRTKYWRVYAEFGKIALQNEPHLRLLSAASSAERPERLPSWCPNLCSPAKLDKLDEVGVFAAGWPWKGHLSIVGPDGCKGHPHFKSPEESHVTLRENSNVISIWGVRLDCIRAVVPKDGWSTFDEPNDLETIQGLAKGILKWFEECEKFCTTYGKYEKTPSPGRTVWNRVLVTQNSSERRPKKDKNDGEEETKLATVSNMTEPAGSSSRDRPQAQLSSAALDRPEDIATHTETLTPSGKDGEADTAYIFMIETMSKLLELNSEEEQIEEVNRHVSDFELCWSWLLFMDKDWDGRALFATEGGYLGCAPKDVAAGDVVCMLYGGRTLYVLREEEDGYRFIGEAYVYECMDGQIFEMLDQGLVMEETFLIF
jgi:hypothetical protein